MSCSLRLFDNTVRCHSLVIALSICPSFNEQQLSEMSRGRECELTGFGSSVHPITFCSAQSQGHTFRFHCERRGMGKLCPARLKGSLVDAGSRYPSQGWGYVPRTPLLHTFVIVWTISKGSQVGPQNALQQSWSIPECFVNLEGRKEAI